MVLDTMIENPETARQSLADDTLTAALEGGLERSEADLDLTPGEADGAVDPVASYLREMGQTPLLTREGEVRLAQQIERGQARVWKAISRSPPARIRE